MTSENHATPPEKDNPLTYPVLGRLLLWVDRPGSATTVFRVLAGLCALVFVLDFTYEKHGYFAVENLPGFFGVYGFVMFTGLIIAAKTLRFFIKRPEDFYKETAVDCEEYPVDQLEKVKHDGL